MMAIGIKADIDRALAELDDYKQRQVPFATAVALTRTAKYAKGVLVTEMDKAFDRPTPYTRNALYVQPATKRDLKAEVLFRSFAGKGNPATRFLTPEVYGGTRRPKAFENLLIRNGIMPAGWFAIPASGAQLDAYGNVPGSLITKMLSQLRASSDPTANESAEARRKRNRRQAKQRYFAVGVNSGDRLKPGIYERLGIRQIRPVFIFTRKPPHYKKRYRFYEVGEDAARGRFPVEFDLSMRQAIATAK